MSLVATHILQAYLKPTVKSLNSTCFKDPQAEPMPLLLAGKYLSPKRKLVKCHANTYPNIVILRQKISSDKSRIFTVKHEMSSIFGGASYCFYRV